MSKSKNLVIVESPAKAKTIQKYLGSDFEVESSFGHIRDLPKKNDAIDIANNFEPNYIITPEKKKVVAKLKSAAKGKTVWLASDEDREGEAIAWHLCAALNLDPKQTKRIVWQNITLAFLVKAIVLILGAGGLATMWEAVFADVGVSLIAILNATKIFYTKYDLSN